MNFKMPLGVGAKFKLIVRRAKDNSVARETEWFHNLVLDTGLNRMSVGKWIDRCCVGTGNSIPVATQTALDSFSASTTNIYGVSTGRQTTNQPYYHYAKVTWRFNEGVAAGNISEVGVGWGNANLWNRALIKDANGNPTTITILSDEYLDVVSEIRILYTMHGSTGSFSLLDKNGIIISNHTYTVEAIIGEGVWNTNNVYLDYMRSGFSQNTANNTASTNPTANSTRLVGTYPLSATGTTSYLQAFIMNCLTDTNKTAGYKANFTPPISKLNTQVMQFTIEFSWGRYTG